MRKPEDKKSYVLQSPGQIGAYLRSLRNTQGLTQRELGARIGVSGARISEIEHDPGALGLTQLLRLLHVLNARLVLDVGELSRNARLKGSTPTGEW